MLEDSKAHVLRPQPGGGLLSKGEAVGAYDILMNLNEGDTLHIERSSDLPRRAENGSHSSVFTEVSDSS